MSSSAYKKRPKTKPFPIRLTEAERTELERRSGSVALGSLIKGELFSGDGKHRRAARSPVKDQISIAQLLGLIGKSHVGARLDYLVDAHKAGALILDQETSDSIIAACAEVHAMRVLLLKALGHRVDEDDMSFSLPSSFNDVAEDQT